MTKPEESGDRGAKLHDLAVHSEIRLLGMKFTPCTQSQLSEAVAYAVTARKKAVIANHNLHSLYLWCTHAGMRLFYEKSWLTHIDGMGVVALLRLLGHRVGRDQRVTYVDWVWPLLSEASRRGWRVYFLGGRPDVTERARTALMRALPTLQLKAHHGYFDPDSRSGDNGTVLEDIRSFNPDILMVGMGMPRQEIWILENLPQIAAQVILPVGACMDYVADAVPAPPRWMGRMGLDWVFRLAHEPRRLAFRYLAEPPLLLILLVQEHIRQFVSRRR